MDSLSINIIIIGVALCAIIFASYYCIDGFVSDDYLFNQRQGGLPTDPTCPRGSYSSVYKETPNGSYLATNTICSGPAEDKDVSGNLYTSLYRNPDITLNRYGEVINRGAYGDPKTNIFGTSFKATDVLTTAAQPAYLTTDAALRNQQKLSTKDPLSDQLSATSLSLLQDDGTGIIPPTINFGQSTTATLPPVTRPDPLVTQIPPPLVTPITRPVNVPYDYSNQIIDKPRNSIWETKYTQEMNNKQNTQRDTVAGNANWNTYSSVNPSKSSNSYDNSEENCCEDEDEELCEGFSPTLQPTVTITPSQLQAQQASQLQGQPNLVTYQANPQVQVNPQVNTVNLESALRQPAQRPPQKIVRPLIKGMIPPPVERVAEMPIQQPFNVATQRPVQAMLQQPVLQQPVLQQPVLQQPVLQQPLQQRVIPAA
jgi:hypothetical protein